MNRSTAWRWSTLQIHLTPSYALICNQDPLTWEGRVHFPCTNELLLQINNSNSLLRHCYQGNIRSSVSFPPLTQPVQCVHSERLYLKAKTLIYILEQLIHFRHITHKYKACPLDQKFPSPCLCLQKRISHPTMMSPLYPIHDRGVLSCLLYLHAYGRRSTSVCEKTVNVC